MFTHEVQLMLDDLQQAQPALRLA